MEYTIIFNVTEINKIDFTQVLETDQSTLRLSVNKTKTFVTCNDSGEPTFISTLTTKEGPYDYNQTIQIMATPEWYINPFIV